MRIVVVGSSNTDMVITAPRLPAPGETVKGGEFAQFAGGKGANQAVAAARAGARVIFVGAHGPDVLGRAAKAGLRHEGIGVRHFVEKPGVSSGVALIFVGGKKRENMIGVARSANDVLTPSDVRRAEPEIRRAKVVLAQLEVPLAAVEAAAKLAEKHAVPFVLNPAPAAKVPASLLARTYALTPNEHEARIMTGRRDPREAARLLLRRGCRLVVVTLGARGAFICTPDGEALVPAPRVVAVDTVGAGDCFSAWLAVGIAGGLAPKEAVHRANCAAARAVTRPGAQTAMPGPWPALGAQVDVPVRSRP
jgi:ribokinase